MSDKWLRENLVCPRDKTKLRFEENVLISETGHRYPVVDGVPIMLLDNVEQTLWVASASLAESNNGKEARDTDKFYIETLGISEDEKRAVRAEIGKSSTIDPVVKYIIAATSGYLYKPLIGKLETYPIPEMQLPPASGEKLLDIGCNWGRWCVAASRKGYSPVGLDPSVGAVMAARRVCRELNVEAIFVVGDARLLPFAENCFDVAFSYSVLQHFSKENVRVTLREVARVLKQGGTSFIQMANARGVRSLYHQAKRSFSEGENFDVRYWQPAELKRTFQELIGASELSVDGFFGLGIQRNDVGLLPYKYQTIVKSSELLRRASRQAKWLTAFADSIYITSKSK